MHEPASHTWVSRRTIVIGTVFVCLVIGAACLFLVPDSNGQSHLSRTRKNSLTLEDIPFDGAAALEWIHRICAIGPRVSGSPGIKQQQELLMSHFKQLGGHVELQAFAVRHPVDGSRVPMANLIVRWHPDRSERILLCAHYDTRPYPDRDPIDPKGIFLGANDGASGVAVLAELGRHMPSLDADLGVDFAFFDGEELVYDQSDRYFLGSEYFAREYAGNQQRNFTYRAAVLLDMVGDQFLDLYQERNGLRWRDSRWIVTSIWEKAKELEVTEFIPRPWNTEILDDHVMLHRHGGIPACDIIDFYYRSQDRRTNYWHTRADTPDKCSALSLAKVGWVVHEWLKDQAKKTK